MSTVTSPMRSLLKAEVPFMCNTEHEDAFNIVKEILSMTPGLHLFGPNLKVQIQHDASKTGIGACLMQEGQPVAYYSKSLTPMEMNWFPIEKECLAVVCAEIFQHYIYGREVEVRSDHKSLEMITSNSIHKASLRIHAAKTHQVQPLRELSTWTNDVHRRCSVQGVYRQQTRH